MPKRPLKSSEVRLCANIKSRKHPDARCPLSASQGDFCARHSKRPCRFQEKSPLIVAERPKYSRIDEDSSVLIQKIWRGWSVRNRILKQGPATDSPWLAHNSTDVYSLESVDKIPTLYRWSITDSKSHIWLFDIRTIAMLQQEETEAHKVLMNPYTREPFANDTILHYQKRMEWLRSKKYCVLHVKDDQLTPEQEWHQRILDVFLKIDMLGYYTCLKWFEDMSIRQLCKFYYELFELWYFRLGLTAEQKTNICPEWKTILFTQNPIDIFTKKELKIVQAILLDTIENLVTKASQKENRALGAMYVMTAFALTSADVAEHYDWLIIE